MSTLEVNGRTQRANNKKKKEFLYQKIKPMFIQCYVCIFFFKPNIWACLLFFSLFELLE